MRFRPLAFVSLLLLGACLDSKDYDLNKVSINPSLAFPLVSGELGLIDFVSDKDSSYIKVYPDGLIYFTYGQTFASQSVRQLFNFPDKSYNSGINLPVGTLPPSSVDFRSDSIVQNLDLGLSPEQLSELGFKSGTLSYAISTSPELPNLSYAINLVMTDLVDVNTQLPMNITSGTGSGLKPLQSYKLKMDKNKFNIKVVLVLKKRSNSQFIPASSKINIKLTFGGMAPSYIKGFFGDRTISLPTQTQNLSVFSNSLKKAPVYLVSPIVKIQLSNDNGVPTELSFATLQAKKTGATLAMQITPSSPVTLNYPSVLGTSSATGLTVVNANDLINFSPTQLEYTSSIRINKGLSTANNFIADTSKLRITLSTEIPLYGHATSVVMADTMKLSLDDVNESSVDKAKMKITALNQLPLDVYFQFYLTDKNYVILDSLLATNQTYFVKGSTVAGTGELLTASSADSQIDLSADKVNKVFTASYVIVKARLNTSKDSNGGLLNVKFKSSYKLNLKVGLNVQLKLTAK